MQEPSLCVSVCGDACFNLLHTDCTIYNRCEASPPAPESNQSDTGPVEFKPAIIYTRARRALHNNLFDWFCTTRP